MSYNPKLTPWRCYAGSADKHVEFTDSDLVHTFIDYYHVNNPTAGPQYETVEMPAPRRAGSLYYYGSLSIAHYHILARIGLSSDASLNQTIRGTDSGSLTFGDDKFFGSTQLSLGMDTQAYWSGSVPQGNWNGDQHVNIFIFGGA